MGRHRGYELYQLVSPGGGFGDGPSCHGPGQCRQQPGADLDVVLRPHGSGRGLAKPGAAAELTRGFSVEWPAAWDRHAVHDLGRVRGGALGSGHANDPDLWRRLGRRGRTHRRLPALLRQHPFFPCGATAVMSNFKSPNRTRRSAELFPEACELIPAGVNSTARARFSGWEPYPIFADHGTGSHLFDVDGNEYIDYLLGLGPMILGHRPPKVTAAVVKAIEERGTVFALPTTDEITLARRIIDLVPSIEQVRLCNTGTEAVLYALRLARTFTGRTKVIRFEGMYHGFSDGVYWSKHPP